MGNEAGGGGALCRAPGYHQRNSDGGFAEPPGGNSVSGGRRTGKTSTLLNLEGFLSSHIKPVLLDFQNAELNSSIEDFCTGTARSIGKVLKDDFLINNDCRSPGILTGLLKKLQPELEARDEALLLCFDEYERIGPPGTPLGALPNLLRHWMQHMPSVVCLFSGSHPLGEIKNVDWSDYLINTRVVPISYLDEEPALKLITAPVPRFDLSWAQADLPAKVTRRLGCQPYMLQVFMFHLTERLNREGRKTAKPEDIEISITELFKSAEGYLIHFWEKELLPPEREILLALAGDRPLPPSLFLSPRKSPPSQGGFSHRRRRVLL